MLCNNDTLAVNMELDMQRIKIGVASAAPHTKVW